MKIVADTNILVSALIKPRGIPAQIMAHQASFALVATEEMLSELHRVLHYPHIQKKYQLSKQAIAEYVASLRHDSILIEITKSATSVSEDPDDDKFLACAEGAGADCIVSGDPHLVSLGSYKGIPILTPRQFLATLS